MSSPYAALSDEDLRGQLRLSAEYQGTRLTTDEAPGPSSTDLAELVRRATGIVVNASRADADTRLELRKTVVLYLQACAAAHGSRNWFSHDDDEVVAMAVMLAKGVAEEETSATTCALVKLLLREPRFYTAFADVSTSWAASPLGIATSSAHTSTEGVRCHEQWMLLWTVCFGFRDAAMAPPASLVHLLASHVSEFLLLVVRCLRSPDYVPRRYMTATILRMWRYPHGWWPALKYIVDSPAVVMSLLPLLEDPSQNVRYDAFHALKPVIGFPHSRKSPAVRAIISANRERLAAVFWWIGPQCGLPSEELDLLLRHLGTVPPPSEAEVMQMNSLARARDEPPAGGDIQ